jgi:hypothetical protein
MDANPPLPTVSVGTQPPDKHPSTTLRQFANILDTTLLLMHRPGFTIHVHQFDTSLILLHDHHHLLLRTDYVGLGDNERHHRRCR